MSLALLIEVRYVSYVFILWIGYVAFWNSCYLVHVDETTAMKLQPQQLLYTTK